MDEKKHDVKPSNSIEEGKIMFEWLIKGLVSVDKFMSEYWEKKTLLIQRPESRDYYANLLSTEVINSMIKDNYLEFTKNIDITSYRDGVRETHNPEGRAVSRGIFIVFFMAQIFDFRQHQESGITMTMVALCVY